MAANIKIIKQEDFGGGQRNLFQRLSGLSVTIFFAQTCLPAKAGAAKKDIHFYPAARQPLTFNQLLYKRKKNPFKSDSSVS